MASQELQTILQMLKATPVPAAPPTVEEQRAGINAMAAMNPLPTDVQCTKVDVAGVPGEWINAPGVDTSRVVLYLHGGGYVIGSIDSHRELVARMSRASGARALAIDYRMAPENPFPAAVDDAVAAYRWLLAQGVAPAGIAIAGDSAGGGLTIATLVALKQAGVPLPAAGVCFSPWVDLEGIGESMTARDGLDPMVHRDMLVGMASTYLHGADPRTPLAAPLYADLSGLPPLLIQVGTAETLFDDSTRIAARATAAGVDVTLEECNDMFHVFQLFAMLPEARAATDRAGTFIREKTAAPAGARA
jgi:monoterpene epsilon-lactone hydrolase